MNDLLFAAETWLNYVYGDEVYGDKLRKAAVCVFFALSPC